jgi:hypothetical protein
LESRGAPVLSVDQVREILTSRTCVLAARRVPLADALGLRLAEALLAPEDEPAFDRSAMDGFAIASEAGPGRFRIVGECLPGQPDPAITRQRRRAARVHRLGTAPGRACGDAGGRRVGWGWRRHRAASVGRPTSGFAPARQNRGRSCFPPVPESHRQPSRFSLRPGRFRPWSRRDRACFI